MNCLTFIHLLLNVKLNSILYLDLLDFYQLIEYLSLDTEF